MKLATLDQLLVDQLKDLYSAETQLTKALPKMAKQASNDALKQALQNHLEETRGQVERLQQIAEHLDAKLTGKKCKAMEGLIEEGAEVLEAEGDEAMIDLAIIAAAQRVEHYEIASYGSAREMAQQLGHEEITTLLQETLNEEGEADKLLTRVALEVYPSAAHDEGGEMEDEEESGTGARASGARDGRTASKRGGGSAGSGRMAQQAKGGGGTRGQRKR